MLQLDNLEASGLVSYLIPVLIHSTEQAMDNSETLTLYNGCSQKVPQKKKLNSSAL